MINKRILYEKLYQQFYPQAIVAFATTNGYRMCSYDQQMVDYDVLYAIDPSMKSKTWIEIGKFNGVPHIVIKINDFFVAYNLVDILDSIENQTPSYRTLPKTDQAWVEQVYTTINQAFVDAGYVFP